MASTCWIILIIFILLVLIMFGVLYWMGYLGSQNCPSFTPICPTPTGTSYEPCASFRSDPQFSSIPTSLDQWDTAGNDKNTAISIIMNETGMDPNNQTQLAKMQSLSNRQLFGILFGKNPN